MGQQGSHPIASGAGGMQATGTQADERRVARLHPLPPMYVPLCDTVKAGDPAGGAVSVTTEDIKDTLGKILEFNHSIRFLPKENEVSGAITSQSAEQQLHEIVNSVDSVNDLFQYISILASLPIDQFGRSSVESLHIADDSMKEHGATPGVFGARVSSYVKNLQSLYQLTKKEKYRYEQRLTAARSLAASQRKVTPPPLPLPTQNCMTMGWDLVVHLLKTTRADNPQHYLHALQMIKDNFLPLKPTTYSDSMYLAPSASSAFNLLSECLGELAYPVSGNMSAEMEIRLGASTVEALAEVGLARGSLATVLFVVLWLMKQPSSTSVNIGVTLSKLAALKEQPMYGKCEASGELYCCGQNSYGELGVGDDIERHQLTSVSLCGWDDIRQVVSGNETLAILTNDGVVLTCGLNKSGQCGQGHFDERVMLPRPVQALRSQKIKFIAASNGCEHMIALTETGLAYSWGYNDRGQLGHENLTTKIHIPKLIESMKDKKLSFAAVSYHHSAMVTDTGELYTFGMNDCGQLGLDHTQHQSTPQLVKSLESQEVTMVSCGLYHTIICTASGELYSCGKNDYGQLGLGHSRQVKVPTLAAVPNEMICFVACGYYHSIAVSTTGRAYSFGRNDYGQLGIGTKIHQNIPNVVAISANTRIIRGACGCYHTVLLSEQGQVFVFGRNNKGQLGNRGSSDSLLPVPLKVRPEKNSRRCIDVAAGFYTTSLIVERKRENDDGDTVVLDQSCIVSICGRVDLDRSGEIEGLSNFGSISTVGVSLFQGKWFYEVEVVTSGLIQIGWIDGYFQGSSDQGEGVGDHSHSWSYDGNRQRRWNSGSSSYGEKWKAGDVIGCLLDLTTCEMSFFRNGINLGVAYSDFKCDPSDKKTGLMPGISLERGEIIRVNLGHQPFAYPPTIASDFDSISRAIVTPASSAVLKTPSKEVTDASTYPPVLEGSASVLVKNMMFVVGGSVMGSMNGNENAQSNQVWVYYLENKRWERWTDFPINVCHHQVVAIDDDHILVIGGESDTPSSRHMDLYKCSTLKNADGSLPSWELIQGSIGAATSLPQPRAFHTAASIRVRLDSMVFMYGGKSTDNDVLGDAWYLSLDDYSWSRLPSSLSLDPGPRTGCSCAVIGECVYVFGGQDKEDKLRADLWRYNTFDRQWHLCHDDNISSPQDTNGESSLHPRSEFNPVMPEPRMNYSICADLGNVWVYGGVDRSGQHLNDLWYYSITLQKWTSIELNFEDNIEGWSCATLFVMSGMATALYSASDSIQSPRVDGNLHVFGGRLKMSGAVAATNRLCCIATSDSTRSYNIDPAKSVSTVGKSAHVLGVLRAKCGAGTSKTTQHCVHEALDSAICMLSHLDRLAGNDIPSEDTETIQLSRCTYRSLCIDPKEKTFSAMHLLLGSIVPRFVGVQSFEEHANHSEYVIQVLYPLLVTTRLLKLNFFELSRCCLDTAEVGLSTLSTKSGGVLHSIRELLFQIAEHSPKVPSSGELLWFYHAVKQETASSIYYGFSTLFPSLLDRIQVMNRLLTDTSASLGDCSPTKKLLVPMLVPCFTSAKMLFQLMNESRSLFESPDATLASTTVIIKFVDTLTDALWRQTCDLLGDFEKIGETPTPTKALDMLENSYEFKCLNVLLRAAIYWCSLNAQDGWHIIESVCLKFVLFTSRILQRATSMQDKQVLKLPLIIQNTFAGKLLPFTLLSVFSLPSIRQSLPSLLDDFWPQLEQLTLVIDSALKALSKEKLQEQKSSASVASSGTSSEFNDADLEIDTSQGARISRELATCLSLSGDLTFTYDEIFRSIWMKTSSYPGFKCQKVNDCQNGIELHRIAIPLDLMKLFCAETLLIKCFRDSSAPGRQLEYDQDKVSFSPNRTILSQHIYPMSPVVPCVKSVESSSSSPESKIASKSSNAEYQLEFLDVALEDGCVWLQDLQKILVWVGSNYAATLITGTEPPSDSVIDPRWASSPLFQGGLEEDSGLTKLLRDDSHPESLNCKVGRNELLLQQIVENSGPGKKLVDKVRNALDPGAGFGGGNPQLRATRLKRQDSVDAAIEKSGGYEAVDRAVRVAFAVLLKHSNIFYMAEPLSRDGIPSEAVVDAWRSALQLRRWIVREQQKLAASSSEKTSTDVVISEADMKERQQTLYNAVCEPIIRRALLLLQLSPAPTVTSGACSSPLKLLPGISSTPAYDFSKAIRDCTTAGPEKTLEEQSARQLNKLMQAKSVEMIEEEDERIQLDIFSFLQQSNARPTNLNQFDDEAPVSREEAMKTILESHQHRAQQRLKGIKSFLQLLECTETIPSSRFHIIPVLSSAFKRSTTKAGYMNEGITSGASIVKVHYLEDLEFAGSRLSSMIGEEFFNLLSSLLASCTEHLAEIKQLVQSSNVTSDQKPRMGLVQKAIHDTLLVLEACCLPYRSNDWDHIHRIRFPSLLTELISWTSWKDSLQFDLCDDSSSDHFQYDCPILPAGAGSKCPKIICSHNVTIGTDLHKLTLTHKSELTGDSSSEPNGRHGGLAVFDKALKRGRWYWEVSLRAQTDRPVFVGVTCGTADLNFVDETSPNGVYLYKDALPPDGCARSGIRWREADVLGVLLSCDERKIDFFNATKCVYSILLGSNESFPFGYYPTIGIQDAEVCFDLSAPIPVKLWSLTTAVQFQSAVVSGGLVAAPFDGSLISWDGRRKGRHIQLSSNATTIVAGDSNGSDNSFETVLACQGFDSGMLFVEVHILCPGRDGRFNLGFGIVGSNFTNFDDALLSKATLKCDSLEESWSKSVFGVLFDFEKGTITIYSSQKDPAVFTVDVSAFRKPWFPAASVLCNGTVCCVNFHPQSRPELPPNTCYPVGQRHNFHPTSSNELQIGKSLQLQVQACDGGEFSSSHSPRNCLLDDSSVFSSAKGSNVNLVLKHEVDTPFCLSYITIRGPGPGYSSPLRHALVFVTSSSPDLECFQDFDDMSPTQFAALPFPPANDRSQRDEFLPVAYFVLDGSCAQISKQLVCPVTGRYVLVKLICPSSGSNIDVGYIGFCGAFDRENGPAYNEQAISSYSCEECKRSPLSGVYYGLKDDDTVKMCSACYDDNRGSLDDPYFAHITAVEGHNGMHIDEGAVLCASRKFWYEKVSALLDITKKSKPSLTPHFDLGVSASANRPGVSENVSVTTFDDCELFSCGQNNYGELCLGHCNSTSKLEHVPFFSTKSVRDIAGGNEVLAVVLKDGTVYTCGLNKSGQCGNGTFEERVILATPVRALSGILIDMVAAANGCEHMLAVAADGAVYSWGYNDRGQLGLGSTISKSHTPRLIDSLREKYHISYAAVSYHHSAVVSSAGELLTFGMNDCGQLGLDHTQHQHTPQLVDALSSQVITKVACGLYHTVVVTAGGEVYAFGKNDYGQLGLGHARNVKVPNLVKISTSDNDEKIVDVSCGYYHTVVITEKGKLITWGRNDYGQLGIGSKDHKNTPQFVPLPLSSKITKTSCGCYHTLILLSNGRVMVFGRNNKGQLGAGARTLPSADLPLPVPSNSLSNDDVVCIAAGFYSSYILTGRSGQGHDPENGKDDPAQLKDLPEHSCLVNSDALYESLMKEMDRHNATESAIKRAPIPIKRTNIQRKLPLMKLHAAAWALTRALMYQSLRDRASAEKSKASSSPKKIVNPVLRMFTDFLLENLKVVQAETLSRDADSISIDPGNRSETCVSLKNTCIGLLKYFSTKTVGSPSDHNAPFDATYAHFYQNQLLWVLLRCGSVDSDVSSIIAGNQDVTEQVIKGMDSNDLSSATICIRLAMLVFPLHSISSLNKIHRSIKPSSAFSGDIMSSLMLLVGNPLVLRPRLCVHELGIECSSSVLCHNAKCLKGVSTIGDCNVSDVQIHTLEKSHVALAKSSEALSLIRYLTLYPTWKVAVNAALNRGFAKTEKLGEILDTVCAYYANVQAQASRPHVSAVQSVDPIDIAEVKLSIDMTSVRKPESTSSPEIDDSASPDGNSSEDKQATDLEGVIDSRDKKSLMYWQKAKDALDGLATILAAISIVGGHTELFREGGHVSIEGNELNGSNRSGLLAGIKQEPRSDIMAFVMLTTEDNVESDYMGSTPSTVTIPIKNLQSRELVPAVLGMFDNIDSILTTLSAMILPIVDEFAVHSELDQPQNNSVQEILRGKLKFYKKQIQWRSTKALSSLLMQMPSPIPTLANSDSQLVANLAVLLASENALSHGSNMMSMKLDGKQSTRGLDGMNLLHNKWVGLKQHQICLDTESVIDSTLDHYESEIREEVVSTLGKENALSWGIDAIQSPRRNMTTVPHGGLKPGGPIGSSMGARSNVNVHGRNSSNDFPFGVWGVLQPLPQLNENENASGISHSGIDFTPFHLSTPIVRVGRAADSCDLIVNDRSVSGRHFHLRRIRRDNETSEDYFELQDFSKNGTIVNGVRVHGTSVRITPGSRISLILSRGGLVTYEFHVRVPATGASRLAPPPIITTPQNPGDLNIMIPGQEYQQPQNGTPGVVEPRSPAEIQNRGARTNEPSVNSRNRIAAAQGLRLITSIAESEVPRALISPNPAVDSPRVGGFNSPRSSMLQAPGTPAVGSPTASMYQNMVPPGVLSPASYQQRESIISGEPGGIRMQENVVNEALRIALGRESVHRETVQRSGAQGFFTDDIPKSRLTTLSGEISLATSSTSSMARNDLGGITIASELHARLQDAGYAVTKDQCEQALHATEGDFDDAFAFIQLNYPREMVNTMRESFPPNVRQLATALGKREEVCAEALRQTENNFGAAVRLLLSSSGSALERAVEQSLPSRRLASRGRGHGDRFADLRDQESDLMMGYQDVLDENPSYALTESSALQSTRRFVRSNGSPPHKGKTGGSNGELMLSELSMWSECNGCFDDRVRQMNWHEAEQEEENLSHLLTAVHARRALYHAVRLLSHTAYDGDNPLSAVGDRLVLRQLISSLDPLKATWNQDERAYRQANGKIQQILDRAANDAMRTSMSGTLTKNLQSVHLLSTLTLSVDATREMDPELKNIECLIQALVLEKSSDDTDSRADNGHNFVKHTLIDDVMFDTMMHIISRTFVSQPRLVSWDTAISKNRKLECLFPKGPFALSGGLECMVVNTYDRVWSVPSPDPLLKYRHKWRRRQASTARQSSSTLLKTASDHPATIWRPTMPAGVKSAVSACWFNFGDVIHCGNDAPDSPIILVNDRGDGLLLPPVGFERVDVTGKGLPQNTETDDEFQRKQQRSIWWPVAPPGYVAMGCIAGSKFDPFEPPALASVRCVREDLVKRVNSFRCVWKAEANTSGALSIKPGGADEQGALNAKNQSDNGLNEHDDVVVQTSLWSVNSGFCGGLLPVITLNDLENSEPGIAFALNLSEEDKILCAPVSVSNVLAFVDTLLLCQKTVREQSRDVGGEIHLLRPELSVGLFALVRQVLREKTPTSGQLAVDLVRALIKVIQNGGRWNDKRGLLFCRSRIMVLNQDQEGGLMHNALLQALVELMLAVEEQNKEERVQELSSCLGPDSLISLPYRYHFARTPAHVEMMVSHSSKMTVTRHFSGEERKFLLDYHAEDANPTAAQSEIPLNEHYSCRFEHTPELVMTMNDVVKAEIVYFEVTVVEWNNAGTGSIGFGYSIPEFSLEGAPVGFTANGARSYSFTPSNGKVQSTDTAADHWRWNEQIAAVTTGDVFGCGLRLDTEEIFFTKNGQLLGIAFSSIDEPRDLHPTISLNTDCKLVINFGQAVGHEVQSTKANFSFRFNSMDCDNLMGAFEWYEHLSQVYGVMKSLMNPARDEGQSSNSDAQSLPNEFMLSADNFLSEISEDVCIRVESTHPYDLELQEALVSIPLAASIRVKLDQQCETANSHCLQILQGGENAESGELEVRAFTGGCGGQEVMIEGDSFVWRFPVQSNFQCRVDRIRKGPYLKLENRDTRLSLTRDKGWQTAIGVARFDSGVHIWEVRISFVTASSNIFLGIARKDVRLDSYLGKDNRGWGWIGNRALWHNGSKQRGTYGEKFKTGDIVKMTLDLKRGTLSYALNGKDLGVAFGPGGTGPKLEGTFYPGFALYNQRDSIDLIGGHRVEDGGVDALHQTGSGLLGDETYYSEDESEAIGDAEEGIPNFRMELATALSQMGFPMEWCVYALKHCDDDAEQAADFILANMHAMDALVREEVEAYSRHSSRNREILAEQSMPSLEPTELERHALSMPMSEDESGSSVRENGTAADSIGSPNIDKWGVAFTAVPEFSVTGRRLLATKYSTKLKQLQESQRVFTLERDCALVQIVNEICEARAEALLSCDPLRMSPEEFVPTDEHLRRCPCLAGLPLAQLQKRFLILRNFNCRLQNSLSFIDFSINDDHSLLANGARALRGIIFQHVKLAWWLSVLKEQQSPAAARPEIEVDRHRAREATESTGDKESVFAQVFEQLHGIQPSLLRGADRAFKCQFVGEFGDDFGGLYRECLAQISSELQSTVLPLLKPCPNAVHGVGENREVFVPNAHLRKDSRLVQMAEFLGKLVGIAVRTKTPLDLNLPSVVWKLLVQEPVTRRDIEHIHYGCFQVVDTIHNIDVHGITEGMFDEIVDATFTVRSSTSHEDVELVPGGAHVRVTWDDKAEYARAVESYRLSEFRPVCDDIARGVATMLPAPTLGLFTWKELLTLVCGKATVDIDLLRRRTIYGDGCQASDPHIAFFWDVLGEFTDEQKSAFLRFVWGRSRLPTHAADFTQDFKISGLPKAAGRADMYLPIAHTCFFSIDLPMYSCRNVMKDKLLYAITHCQSIDADNTTVAQRAGQGLNWTNTTTMATAAASAATMSASAAAAAATVSSVIAGISALTTES